jgi:putative membrane protein
MNSINLDDYILKDKTDTNKGHIYLHNLQNDSSLFNIISKLREKYKDEIFVITQDINITNKIIDKEINFSNCFFAKNVNLSNCIFAENVNLSNCIFQENVNLLGCIFYKNSTFSYIKNKQGEIIANATIFQKEVNFFKANFKEHVNFSGCKFNLKADFSETIFGIKKEDNNSDESSSEVKFLIENAKFQKEVDFSKAIFYDAIYFSETEFCTDIEDYAKESINFENAQFKRKVRFHHCKFQNTVRFENTSFNKLVDFYCAHFYKPQQFHFTDFLDRAIFSNTEFNEEVQFLHCRVDSNSYIRFESATFKKSLDISRSNFNDKANFWNIELEEGDILTSSKYQDDFEVHKNEINSEKTVPSIYKQLRETYRIIKSNFYSQNNKIEGLKFYEKEMSVYLEEKREETNKKSPPKNKKTFIEKFREKFIEEPILNIGLLLVSISTFLWAILKCPIFYIASVIFTSLIILGIIIKNKESLKYRNPIKQNYYMPIILLVIATVLIYIYIYNIENPWYIIGAYIVLLCAMLLLYFSIEKDKIILWFNKNSNEFDTNWVVGVNFSLLVGTLTYLIVLLSMFIFTDLTIDNINSSIFLTSLVDVFNITKWDNLEIIGVKLKDLSYLFLFIGRIFIGYGYYQTIQAFRKFGKS